MKVVAATYLSNFNFMAFVPWPPWLKYQRSENTKKKKKKRRNHWLGVVHCLPTRWPVLSILFFITIIEARLHRVSFETCSPQTPDPIIENVLQGHIYRFCLYNFVEFGTLLHYQERTARVVVLNHFGNNNLQDAICIPHNCRSNGYLDSSIMQENFSFSLTGRK